MTEHMIYKFADNLEVQAALLKAGRFRGSVNSKRNVCRLVLRELTEIPPIDHEDGMTRFEAKQLHAVRERILWAQEVFSEWLKEVFPR